MNNEMLTVDQFEEMCEQFSVDAPAFDYLKAVENLAWLAWPNSRNYTIWLVDENPNYGSRLSNGLLDDRRFIRGSSRFVHFETRREFDRVRYAIEDLYKRLENGREIKRSGVRNMSSVVDDVKNPTGLVHTAGADEAPTKAGEPLAEQTIITNGQDFRK